MSVAQTTVEQHFAKCDVNCGRFIRASLRLWRNRPSYSGIEENVDSQSATSPRLPVSGFMSKCLALTIKSDKDIVNRRIANHEQTSANRWHLDVKLHSAKDIDKELVKWLRNAYDLSS